MCIRDSGRSHRSLPADHFAGILCFHHHFRLVVLFRKVPAIFDRQEPSEKTCLPLALCGRRLHWSLSPRECGLDYRRHFQRTDGISKPGRFDSFERLRRQRDQTILRQIRLGFCTFHFENPAWKFSGRIFFCRKFFAIFWKSKRMNHHLCKIENARVFSTLNLCYRVWRVCKEASFFWSANLISQNKHIFKLPVAKRIFFSQTCALQGFFLIFELH